MIRLFDDNPSRASRAIQIWQILVGKAHNRQTITYGELASLIGHEGAGTMGNFSDPIMRYCIQNELRPLTILVVNRDTGSPGEGLVLRGDENSEREAVYQYPWYNIYPPSENDFVGLYR